MRWFLIPILFLTAIVVSAQDKSESSRITVIKAVTVEGKQVLLKSDGTWEYSKEIESVTQKFDLKDYERVVPDKLGLFFDDYINKKIQFDAWISELNPISKSKDKSFTVTTRTIVSNKLISYRFYRTADLNIVISEKIARSLLDLRIQRGDSEGVAYLARIYAQTIKNDDYKIANVSCIEILGGSDIKALHKFGDCQ